MAILFQDGFEDGDFTYWYPGGGWYEGNPTVTEGAKLHGNYGMNVTLNGTQKQVIIYEGDGTEKRYRARFYIDPNSLVMGTTENILVFYTCNDSWSGAVQVWLTKPGGVFNINIGGNTDTTTYWGTSFPITDAPHCVEIDWKGATIGDNNGFASLWIDGVLKETIANIDNDTKTANFFVVFGAEAVEDNPGSSGTFFLDDFVSNNDGSEIGLIRNKAASRATASARTGSNSLGNLFNDGFESGDLSNWDDLVTDSGNLSVTVGSKLHGSYGLSALINDTNNLDITDNTPDNAKRYRARFYFDPNSATIGGTFSLLKGRNSTQGTGPIISLGNVDADYAISAGDRGDNGDWYETSYYPITDAPHCIEFDWKASSAPGANDGYISLWIDGVLKETKSGLDSDLESVNWILLGAFEDIAAGNSGTIYFDDFASNNTGDLIGLSAGRTVASARGVA